MKHEYTFVYHKILVWQINILKRKLRSYSLSTSMKMNSERNPFDELCRTCTKKSYNMQNLFEDANDGETLVEKIYLCTQIQIAKQIDRPSKICCECAYKLEQAYEFHGSVKNSEQIFRKMLLTPLTNPNRCAKERPIPAEMVEVKMEMQNIDNIIEHDSTTTPIADIVDDMIDVKEEEEQTEYDSLEMEPIIKKQRKQTTAMAATKTKRPIISAEKRGKEKYPNRSFECYRCKEKFLSCWKTTVHLRQHYAAEKFKCNVCGTRFTVLDDYNRHLCQGTSIACSYCNETFDTTVALLNHLEHSHDEKTLFKCQKCAQFYSMELLKQIHMRQHVEVESEDSKPYGCNVCKKRFSTRLSLRNHKEIHSEEKLFLCFECGKSFKTSSSLHTHRICHNEKTIQCPDCPMTFNRIAGFRKHRDVHMNLKYKCNLCHAELRSKDALERHTSK